MKPIYTSTSAKSKNLDLVFYGALYVIMLVAFLWFVNWAEASENADNQPSSSLACVDPLSRVYGFSPQTLSTKGEFLVAVREAYGLNSLSDQDAKFFGDAFALRTRFHSKLVHIALAAELSAHKVITKEQISSYLGAFALPQLSFEEKMQIVDATLRRINRFIQNSIGKDNVNDFNANRKTLGLSKEEFTQLLNGWGDTMNFEPDQVRMALLFKILEQDPQFIAQVRSGKGFWAKLFRRNRPNSLYNSLPNIPTTYYGSADAVLNHLAELPPKAKVKFLLENLDFLRNLGIGPQLVQIVESIDPMAAQFLSERLDLLSEQKKLNSEHESISKQIKETEKDLADRANDQKHQGESETKLRPTLQILIDTFERNFSPVNFSNQLSSVITRYGNDVSPQEYAEASKQILKIVAKKAPFEYAQQASLNIFGSYQPHTLLSYTFGQLKQHWDIKMGIWPFLELTKTMAQLLLKSDDQEQTEAVSKAHVTTILQCAELAQGIFTHHHLSNEAMQEAHDTLLLLAPLLRTTEDVQKMHDYLQALQKKIDTNASKPTQAELTEKLESGKKRLAEVEEQKTSIQQRIEAHEKIFREKYAKKKRNTPRLRVETEVTPDEDVEDYPSKRKLRR